MTSPMPICDKDDIVFHTHPCWAENGANFVDLYNWDVYHNIFGNKKFGIMFGKDNLKVYERKEEYIGKPTLSTPEAIERIRKLNHK